MDLARSIKKRIMLFTIIFILVVLANWGWPGKVQAAEGKSAWEYKGVTISDRDRNLKHYVWETARPPYGPFDKIQLHRFIHEPDNPLAIPLKPSKDSRKVIFFLPGTFDRAVPINSDPAISQQWFFAANGYDVYAIEFRTFFIPDIPYEELQTSSYADALKATADWTYAVFREDIKGCVDMAKEISKANKIFLSGFSRGGTHLDAYAAKYWKEDLQGMIHQDTSGLWLSPGNPKLQKSEAEFQEFIDKFKKGLLPTPVDKWLMESGGYERGAFAARFPNSKRTVGYKALEEDLQDIQKRPGFGPVPEGKSINTLADLVAYTLHYAWGKGILTNYYGGKGDRGALVRYYSLFTRYWPMIQDLERNQFMAYSNCPYMDYDDTAEVTLPILFMGGEFRCRGGSCLKNLQPYNVASKDVTVMYLKDYGHLDVVAGSQSLKDVKEPMLRWMNERIK